MGAMTAITAEFDADTLALIDNVASASGLSRVGFVADAARKMAERKSEFMAFLQKGIDDIDAGRVLTHEDLVEQLKRRRTERKTA